MLKEYTATKVTALPKRTNDFNYQLAVQRLLHHNKKRDHPTRRDYVIDKIQSNIKLFNDPNGDSRKLDTLLVGYQSRLSPNIGSRRESSSLQIIGRKHQKDVKTFAMQVTQRDSQGGHQSQNSDSLDSPNSKMILLPGAADILKKAERTRSNNAQGPIEQSLTKVSSSYINNAPVVTSKPMQLP